MARRAYPRRDDGSIVRPADADWIDYQSGTGNGYDSGGNANRDYTDSGSATGGGFNIFDTEEATTIRVESPTEPPKSTRKPRQSKAKSSGPFTPQHVETTVTVLFSVVAMWRNSPIWAVADPAVEIRPWAGSAANLANLIPPEYAEKAVAATDAGNVAMGLVGMILVRMQMETYQRQNHARANRDTYISEEWADIQAQPSEASRTSNGATVPGTGAGSVNPKSKGGIGLGNDADQPRI